MKRLLLAAALAFAAGGQALAADLPPPAPPPPPPRAPATYVPAAPVFTWTGIYLGVNGGYGFGSATDSFCCETLNPNGFLVGGTLGGNYQFGNFVIGAEGDFDWNDLVGKDATCVPAGCETKSTYLGTARGRAGFAWDRVLFYGTGGAAFGNIEAGSIGGPFDTTSRVGWTAGAGIEGAFTPNWTAKVEYLYVDLGSLTCSVNCLGTGGAANSVTLKENIVRAGINYKFGW